MILRNGQYRLTLRDQSTDVYRRLSLSAQSTYGSYLRLTLTDGSEQIVKLFKDQSDRVRCDHE